SQRTPTFESIVLPRATRLGASAAAGISMFNEKAEILPFCSTHPVHHPRFGALEKRHPVLPERILPSRLSSRMISRAINCERIDVSSFCCVSRATKGAPSTALISSGPSSSPKRSTLNLQLSTSLKADYPIFSHCVEPNRGAAGRWGETRPAAGVTRCEG